MAATVATNPPVGPAGTKVGYWMVGADGAVYGFGDAAHFGAATPAAGSTAVDLEPTPSGAGYWIVTDKGAVTTRGDAALLRRSLGRQPDPGRDGHQPVGHADRAGLLGLHQPRAGS